MALTAHRELIALPAYSWFCRDSLKSSVKSRQDAASCAGVVPRDVEEDLGQVSLSGSGDAEQGHYFDVRSSASLLMPSASISSKRFLRVCSSCSEHSSRSLCSSAC